jgi:hypothetical protein
MYNGDRRRELSGLPARLLAQARQRIPAVPAAWEPAASLLLLSIFFAGIDGFINRRNLLDPTAPFGVFEIEHVGKRPMKVIRDEGYLLIQRRERVA